MWRDRVDQHNTGTPAYERIERVMVERAPVENVLPAASYDDSFVDLEQDVPENGTECATAGDARVYQGAETRRGGG
jgi:hypothetical protein